jgi:hypothetical protein
MWRKFQTTHSKFVTLQCNNWSLRLANILSVV